MRRNSCAVCVIGSAALVMVACGSGDETALDEGFEDDSCNRLYADFQVVRSSSFQQDVFPLMQKSCTAAVCHGGDKNDSMADLWLGPPAGREATQNEIDFVYDSLVNVESRTVEGVALVRRGAPRESFFMLKIDGCHEHASFDCNPREGTSSERCGDPMPNIGAALSAADRDIIRSWIKRGADRD